MVGRRGAQESLSIEIFAFRFNHKRKNCSRIPPHNEEFNFSIIKTLAFFHNRQNR